MKTANFLALPAPVLNTNTPGLPLIQSGYILGRVSGGVGKVELIPIRGIQPKFDIPVGGTKGQVWNSNGGGPGVWGQEILSPPSTGTTNSPTIILQTGTTDLVAHGGPSVVVSGNIDLETGTYTGDEGGSGAISITTGAAISSNGSSSGVITLATGNGNGGIGGANSGNILLSTGNGYNAGHFTVTLGKSLVSGAADITLNAGYDNSGNNGNIYLYADNGSSSSQGFVVLGGTIRLIAATAATTPPSSRVHLYMDSADGLVKIKDSSGSVFTLTGTTGQIVGTTTNNNASAGNVGEYASSIVLIASVVSLTTATLANITSLSLTAGDWDVWAEVWLDAAATTVCTVATGAISTTNSAIPTVPADGTASAATSFGASATLDTTGRVLAIAPCRVSLASTTSMYLNVEAEFTGSTLGAYGKLCARRVR